MQSLKEHMEMHEKAHALRIQFEHERANWAAEILRIARDTAAEVQSKQVGGGGRFRSSASMLQSQSQGQGQGSFHGQDGWTDEERVGASSRQINQRGSQAPSQWHLMTVEDCVGEQRAGSMAPPGEKKAPPACLKAELGKRNFAAARLDGAPRLAEDEIAYCRALNFEVDFDYSLLDAPVDADPAAAGNQWDDQQGRMGGCDIENEVIEKKTAEFSTDRVPELTKKRKFCIPTKLTSAENGDPDKR